LDKPTRGTRAQKLPREVLRHPLRIRIVAACTEGQVTPKEIADREHMSLRAVNYHFRELEKAGYLRCVRKEQVRGAWQGFYVANRQAVLTDDEFARMAAKHQREVTKAVLDDLFARCHESLEAGTLDARADSHLTWIPFMLDERGWKDLMSELTRMLERSNQIQAEARSRIRKSGERAIPTTLALAGFESPGKEASSGSP
jgi:predicted ArsR family transcriptional regulator